MIFDLAQDLSDAVAVMPAEHPKRRLLELLEEAIHRDIQFIDRHPTMLFQCLWNTCWWYDCPEAAGHYQKPEKDWKEPPPWEKPGLKLHVLMEGWRMGKSTVTPGFYWIRALRPAPEPIGSTQMMHLHTGTWDITAVAFSPDGALLAASGVDRCVRIWDVGTGQEVGILTAPKDLGRSLRFSSDNTLLFTGGVHRYTGNAGKRQPKNSCWDIDSGKEIKVRQGEDAPNLNEYFSPDGTRRAVCTDGDTIRIFDIATGNELTYLRGCIVWMRGTVFFDFGAYKASMTTDGTVLVSETATGREEARIVPGAISLSSLAVAPSRNSIALGDCDGHIILYSEGSLVRLSSHTKRVNVLAFSPDGTLLVSGADDHLIFVWDVASGKEIARLNGHTLPINSVAFSDDGNSIVSGADDKTVCVWNWQERRKRFVLELSSPVYRARYYHDNDIYVSFWDGSGHRYLRDGHRVDSYRYEDLPTCLAVSRDIDQLAYGSSCGVIRRWALGTLQYKGEIITLGHGIRLNALTFSPDGQTLASGAEDGTVYLWRNVPALAARLLKGHEAQVKDIAISRNGKLLVTGSSSGEVACWDTTTGLMVTYDGTAHSGPVIHVTFSNDDTRLQSIASVDIGYADDEEEELLWDVTPEGICNNFDNKPWTDWNRPPLASALTQSRFSASFDGKDGVVKLAGTPLAWYATPAKLKYLQIDSSNERKWMGVIGRYVFLYVLEGFISSES